MSNRRLDVKNQGFTIVEVMIATLVFASVLVVITIGITTFTRVYYGGITQSQTQDRAKNIIDDISQAIQFSGQQVTTGLASGDGWRGICVGNQAYDYLLGKQLVKSSPGSGQTTRALLVYNNVSDCPDHTPGSLSGGRELLSPNMRLSNLTVSGSNQLYTINIEVSYGDNDLLHSMTGSDGAEATDVACNDNAGTQFCAVSKLMTSVQQRIIPST